MVIEYEDLLKREIYRLDEISKTQELDMEQTKRLSLLLKHAEQLEITDQGEITLEMTAEEITESLRRMRLDSSQ